MTDDKEAPMGGVILRPAGQENWTLKGEKLARRVPRFAAFVEASDGGEGPLTAAQREFVEEFSSGLAEAVSERADEGNATSGQDGESA